MKKYLLILAFLIPVMAFSQNQPFLNLEEAEKIATAAHERAKQDNWNVVIVIMDAGGHIIYLKKMDGTQVGSIEVAQAKAKSAVFFKRATKVFEDSVKDGNSQILSLPNAVAIEGGLPIFKGETIVGSIGISGVTSAQDGIIAEAAFKAIENIKSKL